MSFQATQYSPEEIRAEKKIIYKNVLLISLSFLLLFVAFESMSKLQSSINVVSQSETLSENSLIIIRYLFQTNKIRAIQVTPKTTLSVSVKPHTRPWLE